jgi:hypothetical protein
MKAPAMIAMLFVCLLIAVAIRVVAGIVFLRLWWLSIPALVICLALAWASQLRKRSTKIN